MDVIDELIKEYYPKDDEFMLVVFSNKINKLLDEKFFRRNILSIDNYIIIPKYSETDRRAYNYFIKSQSSKNGPIYNIQKNLEINKITEFKII